MPTPKALEGIRVVSFEQALAAPLLSSIMAAYGAEVIRVETSTRQDWHRQAGPFVGNVTHPDRSVPYLFVNAGKYGITLNLKKPRAVEIAKHLVARADVVLENFAGGVMAKLGLGYDDLKQVKPDLVMLSAAIYGQTGPYASHKGHGNPLTALTGLPTLTGAPQQNPQYPGFVITDFTAPRAGLVAMLAALDRRRRTGAGCYLDASQFEATVHFLAPVLLHHQLNDGELERIGNRDVNAAPHNLYPCREGRYCAVSVASADDWTNFVRAIGAPDWTRQARFASLADRLENNAALDELVATWTSTMTPEEVMRRLQDAGVAAGVVQGGAELSRDPHLAARGYYRTLSHDGDIGEFTYSGMPASLSETPYEIKPAPMLGEHNEYVFTELLGISDAEFVALVADGVVE